MYTVNVSVEGVAPLMQHRFPLPDFAGMDILPIASHAQIPFIFVDS